MAETSKLLPCPFCGSTNIDPEGWASPDRSGPACDDCSGSADTVELWNSRPQAAGAAQAYLVDDLLHIALREGKATKEDQQSAAKWITWLAQFVPQKRFEAKRDGLEKE